MATSKTVRRVTAPTRDPAWPVTGCSVTAVPGSGVAPGRRPHGRGIGRAGTAARLIVGLALLGSVIYGQASSHFTPAAWALGLVGFPAALIGWQWLRARRSPRRLDATGLAGHLLNLAVFLALYLTFWYAPALRFTSDAALIFYGSSMLVAAWRGYAGCEVLSVSNWLLGRDDRVGCALFVAVDRLERRDRRAER